MGAGVLLTKRDTFLTRAEYGQLVWIGCGPHTSEEEIAFNEDVDIPVAAILRPRELFTGKQVQFDPCPGNHLCVKLRLVSRLSYGEA